MSRRVDKGFSILIVIFVAETLQWNHCPPGLRTRLRNRLYGYASCSLKPSPCMTKVRAWIIPWPL